MAAILKNYVWALISGTLLALAFPTWSLWPLAWLALIPLVYRASFEGPREGLKQFYVAGLIFYLVLLQWLMSNVYWAGGWAFWGYVALSAFMASYWSLTGAAWCWMRRRGFWGGGAVGLGVLWMAMEHLQARLFTGFGWGSLGYSQGENLFVLQWAAVGGGILVSGILVVFNGLVALAWADAGLRKRLQRGGAAALLLVACHAGGGQLLQEADYVSRPWRVGILQPDFPLEMKWDPEYTVEMVRNTAAKSRALAAHQAVDLFVWPESLVMDVVTAPGIWEEVVSLTRDTRAALFTGAERVNPATAGAPNSSVLVGADGETLGYYDKVHLAPFGEYVPLSRYFPFVSRMVPIIGDIQPGNELKVLRNGDRAFGPLICFEVLFAELAEELRRKGADSIVVITNLGWFGASNAIPEELEFARMRAVETRLPVVHCANTGISGVFDPWGRFTLAGGTFDCIGRYAPFRDDVTPADTIMRRVGGVLPVAAPGPRPVPHGPRIFPWLALACASGMLLWGGFRRAQSRAVLVRGA